MENLFKILRQALLIPGGLLIEIRHFKPNWMLLFNLVGINAIK